MNPDRHLTPAAPDAATEASSLASRRGVAILLLLSLFQFMDVLDASILNIALPSIKQALGFRSRLGSTTFRGSWWFSRRSRLRC